MEFKIEMINATPKIDVEMDGAFAGCVANQPLRWRTNCNENKKIRRRGRRTEGKNGKRIEMLIDFESVLPESTVR